MKILSCNHTDDAEITTVLQSGRPGHVLVVVEGATEGYYTESFHRKANKKELSMIRKRRFDWKNVLKKIARKNGIRSTETRHYS